MGRAPLLDGESIREDTWAVRSCRRWRTNFDVNSTWELVTVLSIHSFIPDISIAPLQVHYYSETALSIYKTCPFICSYASLLACIPSLFVRCAHLTVMISLSRERGLPWLRHKPLQSLALRLGTNSFPLRDPLY